MEGQIFQQLLSCRLVPGGLGQYPKSQTQLYACPRDSQVVIIFFFLPKQTQRMKGNPEKPFIA